MQIQKQTHASMRTLSNKMNNNDKVDGHCYSHCMDLTILDVRWILFFFWWIFLCQFSMFNEKMKNIYWLEIWTFLQNAPFSSAIFSSPITCVAVSNASWRVNSVKMLPTLELFKQQSHCWIKCTKCFKIKVVFHTLNLWNKVSDPHFVCIIFWLK